MDVINNGRRRMHTIDLLFLPLPPQDSTTPLHDTMMMREGDV
jgi:hypothetical protein